MAIGPLAVQLSGRLSREPQNFPSQACICSEVIPASLALRLNRLGNDVDRLGQKCHGPQTVNFLQACTGK